MKNNIKSNMLIIDDNQISRYQLEEVLDKVIWGDALKVLKKLPDECVDMVFMDPPYFLQIGNKKLKRWNVKTDVEGVNEEWDQFSSFEEYDEFIRKILAEVQRIMKPTATIWVIGTYHNIFRIGKIMQDLGFWILNDVIWFKTNPMPNWLAVRFTNATETLIWAVKDKDYKKYGKYTFNKEWARDFSIQDWGNKLAYNVWRIPICTGKERLKDENGKKLHPTQKPEELLRRVILVSTNEGDIVLDPVAGTGTTGVVAKKLGRHYIMIEREEKYVRGMLKRLENIKVDVPKPPQEEIDKEVKTKKLDEFLAGVV
jgi:DNA modification methylase